MKITTNTKRIFEKLRLVSECGNYIAFSGINSRTNVLAEFLLNEFNINLNVSGGWNKNQNDKSIGLNGGPIRIYANVKEFFNMTPNIQHPQIILCMPQEDLDIIEEVRNITEALDKKALNTIVIITRTADEIPKTVVKEIFKIALKTKIDIIISSIIDFGYELGYLIDNPENMPWHYSEIDPDLEEYIIRNNLKRGKFLDIGTGDGAQASNLAQLGFEVTATDIVPYAFKKNQAISQSVRFLKDDILETKLNMKFDYILDRGCFHSFETRVEWDKYTSQVEKLLNVNGILFLKCMSIDNRFPPSSRHPHLFSIEDIYEIFDGLFVVEEVNKTILYQSNLLKQDKAIFAILRKRNKHITELCEKFSES